MDPWSRFQVTNDIAIRMSEAVYFHNEFGRSVQITAANKVQAEIAMGATVGDGWTADVRINNDGLVAVLFSNTYATSIP